MGPFEHCAQLAGLSQPGVASESVTVFLSVFSHFSFCHGAPGVATGAEGEAEAGHAAHAR